MEERQIVNELNKMSRKKALTVEMENQQMEKEVETQLMSICCRLLIKIFIYSQNNAKNARTLYRRRLNQMITGRGYADVV